MAFLQWLGKTYTIYIIYDMYEPLEYTNIYIIIYHHLPIYSKTILLINTCMLCNQMIHKHWKHGKKLMEARNLEGVTVESNDLW